VRPTVWRLTFLTSITPINVWITSVIPAKASCFKTNLSGTEFFDTEPSGISGAPGVTPCQLGQCGCSLYRCLGASTFGLPGEPQGVEHHNTITVIGVSRLGAKVHHYGVGEGIVPTASRTALCTCGGDSLTV
jgi:hypothetical protein